MGPRIFILLLFLLGIHYDLCAEESADNTRTRTSTQEQQVFTNEDVKAEIRFGREVAARIAGKYGLVDDAEVMRYVGLVGATLATNVGRSELDHHFAVIDTDEINSFSAPGGYVFITRGAMLSMQDEAELAGLLAYEISHILNRDMVRAFNIRAPAASEDSSFWLTIHQFIAGPSAPLTAPVRQQSEREREQTVERALDLLYYRGYGPNDEETADTASLVYSYHAGYDPQGLVRWLERLEKLKGKDRESFDKTHPPVLERITRLRKILDQEGLSGTETRIFKKRFEDIRTKLAQKVER